MPYCHPPSLSVQSKEVSKRPMMKAFLRAILSERTYRRLARLPRNPAKYVSRFGAGAGILTYVRLLGHKRGLAEISIPRLHTRLVLRPWSSDVATFEQIFLHSAYPTDGPPCAEVILDAGACIGLSAVYFATRYPKARIIAIEPDESNYKLLVLNTRAYPNIKVVRAGLWSHRTTLKIENPQDEPWAFRTTESGMDADIPAITVEDAMQLIGADHIDILKIDAEGAEREVFGNSSGWLSKIGMIIAELHGQSSAEVFYHAVAECNFTVSRHKENVIAIRQQNGDIPSK